MDYNASGPMLAEVADVMKPYYEQVWGNPSSQHRFGREAKSAVETARVEVAGLIGALPDEIVFTHGGTEANNLALQGFCDGCELPGTHIVTSPLEHSSVYGCLRKISMRGYKVLELPVDRRGTVVVDSLEKVLTPETILLSVMTANNETGSIQPIRQIAEIAHKYGVIVHTDAVQAAGKIPLDVNVLGVDMLSLSGHKIYGPKGIGVLYVRNGIKLNALFRGGYQEGGRMPGTENVPGIVGMGVACRIAGESLESEASRIAKLRDRLQNLLLEKVPDAMINGNIDNRLANTLSISFPGKINAALVERLDYRGVAVSGGSACGSLSPEPSRAHLAAGLTNEEALGALRISLGCRTTADEIENAAHIIADIVNND